MIRRTFLLFDSAVQHDTKMTKTNSSSMMVYLSSLFPTKIELTKSKNLCPVVFETFYMYHSSYIQHIGQIQSSKSTQINAGTHFDVFLKQLKPRPLLRSHDRRHVRRDNRNWFSASSAKCQILGSCFNKRNKSCVTKKGTCKSQLAR